MVSWDVNIRLDSQVPRMNCQIFSTGLSSGQMALGPQAGVTQHVGRFRPLVLGRRRPDTGQAKRLVILFCWPIGASSCDQTFIGVPCGREALTFASPAAKPPFEVLHGIFVLGMVTGPRRQLT